MAGPAKDRQISEALAPLIPPSDSDTGHTVLLVPKDEVQLAIARLYGQGLKKKQILAIALDLLAPKKRLGKRDRTREEQQQVARAKLRRWEQTEEFRDLVYEHAVIKLDLEVPKILKGMGKKGRTRVDAARLALEVTGRHNPKGEQQAPNITVQIANIPRPE